MQCITCIEWMFIFVPGIKLYLLLLLRLSMVWMEVVEEGGHPVQSRSSVFGSAI